MSGNVIHIYCDESCQTHHRYMVFGGIIIPLSNKDAFRAAVEIWRRDNNMTAEMKWGKVSATKLDRYKEWVDLFFLLIGAGRIHFKSVVFNTHEIDYATYHQGDRELGFYKFFYQLLVNKFGPYAKSDEDRLLVFLDRRKTRYRLRNLRDVLNNGIRKKYGLANVLRSVEPLDSKKSDLLQMTDVIIGAIGYHWNDHHTRAAASKARVELAEYIAVKAKLSTLKQETPWAQRFFEIWQFRFRAKKKAP